MSVDVFMYGATRESTLARYGRTYGREFAMAFEVTFRTVQEVVTEVRHQGTEARGEPVMLAEAVEFVRTRMDARGEGHDIHNLPTLNGVAYIGNVLFERILEDVKTMFVPAHVRLLRIFMDRLPQHVDCIRDANNIKEDKSPFYGCAMDEDILKDCERAGIVFPEADAQALRDMFPGW
jgi:hypothetical protein